jgi:hypothetical protein
LDLKKSGRRVPFVVFAPEDIQPWARIEAGVFTTVCDLPVVVIDRAVTRT